MQEKGGRFRVFVPEGGPHKSGFVIFIYFIKYVCRLELVNQLSKKQIPITVISGVLYVYVY
jgi:hypothetical protein